MARISENTGGCRTELTGEAVEEYLGEYLYKKRGFLTLTFHIFFILSYNISTTSIPLVLLPGGTPPD